MMTLDRRNGRGHLHPEGHDMILELRATVREDTGRPWTYEQIAAECGVSGDTVYRICTGRQQRPKDRRSPVRNERTQYRLRVLPDGNASAPTFRCAKLACTLTVAACGASWTRWKAEAGAFSACSRCETGRENAKRGE